MIRKKKKDGDPERIARQLTLNLPPTAPFAVGSDTSQAAAAAAEPSLDTRRAAVFRAIYEAGPRGLTDDEGEALLGWTHQSYSPRRWELAKAGRIVKNGIKRETRQGRAAAAWVAKKYAPEGEQEG